MGRDTFLSNPNKTAIRSPPRRSTRLAASGGGFRGVKRSRRPLKLPTGRMIRAQIRIGERSRTLAGEETSSPIGTARSKVDLSSTALTTESDDAVVPRCGDVNVVENAEPGRGRGHEERRTTPATAASASVILSAPVAPKDAKRPCCCRHHHHPQQEQLHRHHPPYPHQQQDQQHLSPGCQMSPHHHPSAVATLVGRVPSNPRLINIPIPDDPRQWSRLDVRTWLDHVRRVYNIQDLDLDRFPMNGKALCIMSKDMFVYRVPQGGVPLYIDFQLRFRRALGIR